MGDEIVGVLVVLALVDEVADVVQNRGVFKPVPLGGSQAMEACRLVEQAQGEAGDMKAMGFRCLTATGQCHDVAPPHVGNFRFRFEPFTVAMDKVVDDAFTNGLVAQDEFVSSSRAPSDGEGPPWQETGYRRVWDPIRGSPAGL